MITKMKKLSFLVFHQEYESFLDQIRELGVIHIQTRQAGLMTPELQNALSRKGEYKELIKEMSFQVADGSDSQIYDDLTPDELMAQYQSFGARIQEVQQSLPQMDKDIQDLAPWGEFSWESISKLKEAGYDIKFFNCSEREYNKEWESTYDIVEVDRNLGRVSFVVVSKDPIYLGIESAQLPQLSLSAAQEKKDSTLALLEDLKKQKAAFCSKYYQTLQYFDKLLEGDMDLMKVRLQGEPAADGAVIVMDGWIPVDQEQPVVSYLDETCAYYEIRDAKPGDDVPIKLKNNKIVGAYETLTKMYGLPSYSEFDPTPLIAPFFSLFFAFCLGDAGYGIVLILLGLYLKKKMSPSLKPMMNLVIFLGITTMIFGMILGTFFGINLFESDLPDNFKKFMISGKLGDTAYDAQMVLALIIGVVHTVIAMTVKALKQTVLFGFKNALKDWGWLLVVGGFAIVGTLMATSVITANVSKWAFIIIGGIGAIGIYLLNDIHRNPLINIGSGLWDTYNMASGLLGDTLSYVRLYALGLAGGMLGGIFNTLALQAADGIGGIGGWIFCGVIMIAGHTLNIAMSCISAFVHPLRLNFVEYFKNSGYEGTGGEYKPFATVNKK